MNNPAKVVNQNANAEIVSLLNQALADMLALKINAKQAHWNVKAPNFLTLHELFDQVATEADGFADTIAERAVQLGGEAEGTIAHLSKRAAATSHPQGKDAAKHLEAVISSMSAILEQARAGIETADKHGDAVTADILTQVAGGLDKLYWFVTSHQ